MVSLASRKSPGDPEFRHGRLGCYDLASIPSGSPRIWFHAASVGEATGGVATLLSLRERLPEAAMILTSGTPQGLKFARAQLPEKVGVFPFPLDFPKVVSRAIDTFRPDLFVNFETEFWPNFYRRLRDAGIPAVLLNGRLSESSERLYRLASPLFRPVFGQFEFLAMHSREDMERAVRAGAPPARVRVLGSSKYDGLIGRADPIRARFWKELLRIEEGSAVIVGGSLRGTECLGMLRVFRALAGTGPRLLGIFAPRHMNNIPGMCDWLAKENIAYDLLTDIERHDRPRTAGIVLVDRIGALFEIYSVGDLIFCGGTMEPVGGHNILEPAAWSKPVFYGPHVEKVLHEHRLLRGFGGSFTVRDWGDLAAQWKTMASDLPRLRSQGARAKEALDSLRGVVENQVSILLKALRCLN
ncbi:MAG: hypothetical protein LLG06_03260 [Desulfobacteraceae bacterium]|nr:hypothetical protein [Desulfobacteraceae bacterium]